MLDRSGLIASQAPKSGVKQKECQPNPWFGDAGAKTHGQQRGYGLDASVAVPRQRPADACQRLGRRMRTEPTTCNTWPKPFNTERRCPVCPGVCYKAQLVRKFFGQEQVITGTAGKCDTTQNTSVNTNDMSRDGANKFGARQNTSCSTCSWT